MAVAHAVTVVLPEATVLEPQQLHLVRAMVRASRLHNTSRHPSKCHNTRLLNSRRLNPTVLLLRDSSSSCPSAATVVCVHLSVAQSRLCYRSLRDHRKISLLLREPPREEEATTSKHLKEAVGATDTVDIEFGYSRCQTLLIKL